MNLTESPQSPNTDKNPSVVISVSRRHIILSSDWQTVLTGTSSVKALDLTPGDLVHYSDKDGELFIDSISPRRNALERTYRGETKRIVSNLDHLFIVEAMLPLFNTIFIDRVLAVASLQDIPCSLIVNKLDLGTAQTQPLIAIYQELGIPVMLLSAKFGQNMSALEQVLAEPNLGIVTLAGISGVGKSTILNRLIPEALRKTAEVSQKTGAGRQTTTQPCGYLYPRSSQKGLLIVDLPGVQNFGVTHLSKEQVADCFPEIVSARAGCEFSNCGHVNEQKCAVKEAVQNGSMAPSRYQSYQHMLEEIESAREY
jgi:ribosome biogenesis GTPase / thiamine phosphate phosphatase